MPRHLRRRRRDQARYLEFRALTVLHDGPEDAQFWDAADAVVADGSLREDLLVWSHVRELVPRAGGDSSGPAVHEIWRQMTRDVLQSITAERAWQARERLAAALKSA